MPSGSIDSCAELSRTVPLVACGQRSGPSRGASSADTVHRRSTTAPWADRRACRGRRTRGRWTDV